MRTTRKGRAGARNVRRDCRAPARWSATATAFGCWQACSVVLSASAVSGRLQSVRLSDRTATGGRRAQPRIEHHTCAPESPERQPRRRLCGDQQQRLSRADPGEHPADEPAASLCWATGNLLNTAIGRAAFALGGTAAVYPSRGTAMVCRAQLCRTGQLPATDKATPRRRNPHCPGSQAATAPRTTAETAKWSVWRPDAGRAVPRTATDRW